MAEPDPLSLYADTLHEGGWCLRSALVRYAQPEPKRATLLHALMRRLDAALSKVSEAEREMLRSSVARFEELAVTMSAWATDPPSRERPTPFVDAFLAEIAPRFEALGIPEESVDPAEWRGMRSAEGRRPARKSTK